MEKIAVLAGGPSCEREISLLSGKAVCEALKKKGFEAELVDPVDGFVNELKARQITAVFNALHGSFGEDGTVQKILEEAGIPYTGSGPAASERAFHKARAQKMFQEAGVRVPRFWILDRRDIFQTPPVLPCVVKPASAGSSVGVTIVKNADSFARAAKEAFRYSDEVLVDEYIRGRELTIGILGTEAFPVVEIITQRPFYDYQAKYGDAGTRYECPAALTREEASRVMGEARAAYRAVGCEVMGRVDILLAGGVPYVLEINTIPGLTAKSLLPKAARAAGINFPDLCVKILQLSLKRFSMGIGHGKTL